MTINAVQNEGVLDRSARVIINNNFADIALSTAQTDVTSSTTLANVTGLVTETLTPGTYRFRINLSTTANAAGGIKVAFKFGTASMLTSIEAVGKTFAAAANTTARANTATDQASLVASTSAVLGVDIEGVLVVAQTGTLQLQMAQNASNAAATSVFANSKMEFTRIGN